MNDRPDFSQIGTDLRDGLVIGTFIGHDHIGDPIISLSDGPESRIVTARSAALLETTEFGAEVVVMFDRGDPERPIIIGRLVRPRPATGTAATADGERLELSAEREIVLRCGKATITLTRTGKIILRGTYILSRSSGPNKIKGGSIQLN